MKEYVYELRQTKSDIWCQPLANTGAVVVRDSGIRNQSKQEKPHAHIYQKKYSIEIK